MQLQKASVFDSIDPQQFRGEFYHPQKPVVIKKLVRQWPAYFKWESILNN